MVATVAVNHMKVAVTNVEADMVTIHMKAAAAINLVAAAMAKNHLEATEAISHVELIVAITTWSWLW